MNHERQTRLNIAVKAIAGVVIPIVMLRFDPFVLGGQDGESLVGSLSAGAYVLMSLSMTAFLLQLILRREGTLLSKLLSGAIFAGALISGVVGIDMLPFSIVGVRVYGLGLLGLYPFIVSVIYFRTGRSALVERSQTENWRTYGCAFAGFVMVIAIPILMVYAANSELDRLTTAAKAGADPGRVDWHWEGYLTWAGDTDRIVREYKLNFNQTRQRGDLGALYRNLTGRTIEARLNALAHPD
jgi:hypothetical protein